MPVLAGKTQHEDPKEGKDSRGAVKTRSELSRQGGLDIVHPARRGAQFRAPYGPAYLFRQERERGIPVEPVQPERHLRTLQRRKVGSQLPDECSRPKLGYLRSLPAK